MSKIVVPLARSSDSPAFARRTVSAFLADEGLQELIASVALIVSELTTNAVLHGQDPIELSAIREGDALRIEVFDGNPCTDRATATPELHSSGRGLDIVAALAQQWGIAEEVGGKTVWAVCART